MELTNIYHLNEIGGKKNQEDFIWPQPGSASLQDRIFIVCDGVGGSENGELASMIVAEDLAANLGKIPLSKLTLNDIDYIIRHSKDKLVDYVKAQGLNTDMATTFAFLILFDDNALCAWCGDSRICHIRNGEIVYETTDHSLVNTLIRSGEISHEDARTHPKKNIILKAVKADDSEVEYEHYWIMDIRDGDYFLLCTDGLLENIDAKELKALLTNKNEPESDIISSFQSYCENKTRDNYSMYLIRVNCESTKKAVSGTRKYFIVGIALLLVASVIVFWYFDNKRQGIGVNSMSRNSDSGTANRASTPLPFDPSFVSTDTGIEYEILKSDEKVDTLVPQASSTVIQPVDPAQLNAKGPLPVKDSATIKKKKSNGISNPEKSDSSKSSKSSN